MRCLTLADELKRAGAEVAFLCASLPWPIRDLIEGAGHQVRMLPTASIFHQDGTDWDSKPLPVADQQADAEAAMETIGALADWLIVDHYLLDEHWESIARGSARRMLVIDDLANRRHDCDLLLDQTLGSDSANYRPLVPLQAELMCGAIFALLRPEFIRKRTEALERRREIGPARRILVSLGSMDVGGLTIPVVRTALDVLPACLLDVVISDTAPTIDEVRWLAGKSARVTLHVNSRSMAELMRDSDLAIGAAGTSSWERCCLGLPAITFAVAKNQRLSASRLHQAGATVRIDSVADLRESLPLIANDAELLARMSAAAFAITDGAGASRVTRRMVEGHSTAQITSIAFRRAEDVDFGHLWLWRNDPETRNASRSSDPIAWRSHLEWLRSALADPGRQLLIAEAAGNPVGMVRFDRAGDEPPMFEISINVAPEARGSGLGRTILAQACARAAQETGAKVLFASIREDNPPSRRIFEACGFVPHGSAEGEFNSYRLQLDAGGLRG